MCIRDSSKGAEELLRASRATGIRTRTEVSERLSSPSRIVRVGSADAFTPASRSALAARLMSDAGVPAVSWGPPVRSRPAANGIAPSVSEMAIAPKIALDVCDMCVGPSPHGDQENNVREPAEFWEPAIT